MQLRIVKSLLKTGVLEAGLVTAALLLFGHSKGVLAYQTLTPVQALQQGDHHSLRSLLNSGTDSDQIRQSRHSLRVAVCVHQPRETR